MLVQTSEALCLRKMELALMVKQFDSIWKSVPTKRWIIRRLFQSTLPIEWPAWSPELSSFFGVYLKADVFIIKSKTFLIYDKGYIDADYLR